GICDAYFNSMGPSDAPLATLAAIDLGKFDTLLADYRSLGDEALVAANQDPTFVGTYGQMAYESENYYNSPSGGYSDMLDLGDMIQHCQQAGLFPIFGAKVLQDIQSCVIYQVKGSGHQGATGLSFYYNYEGSGGKLDMFLQIGTSQGFNYLNSYLYSGKLTTAGATYLQEASNALLGQAVASQPLDTSSLQALDGYPLTLGSNGQWQLNIGSALSSQVAMVYMTQAWVSDGADPNALRGLYGLTNYFPHDYTNGVFTANFQNSWGALGELAVYMVPLNSSNGYDLYAAPVLINGTRYALIIGQDVASGAYQLLGAALPMDTDTNMAGKELYQLQPGDVVDAIMYWLLPPGQIDSESGTRLVEMPLGEITYTSDTVFHLRPVSGMSQYDQVGQFEVSFVVIDYAGNIYYTGAGLYQVNGGQVQAISR
ncbi:MAG: hypothetical protein FWC59_00655, partial [Actinomycetia bacterium]|nr:hypothetical protein [Actinomycetes bacterium]